MKSLKKTDAACYLCTMLTEQQTKQGKDKLMEKKKSIVNEELETTKEWLKFSTELTARQHIQGLLSGGYSGGCGGGCGGRCGGAGCYR